MSAAKRIENHFEGNEFTTLVGIKSLKLRIKLLFNTTYKEMKNSNNIVFKT